MTYQIDVYCHTCFKSQKIAWETSMRIGNPKCCGVMMKTIKPKPSDLIKRLRGAK